MTTNLILDNTMFKTLNTCPRKFQWRHVHHLTPASSNSAPLDFGTVAHAVLENFYLTGDVDESLRLVLKLYSDPDHPLATDETRTMESCLAIMAGYFKKWLPENFKVIQVETPIQIELSSDLTFCGKVDGIVEFMGDLYILEHKTSKSISSFCDKPNHQISGYTYALKVLGYDVKGAIINLIAVLKTKLDYHRVITTRVQSELEEWRYAILDAKARIDSYQSQNWFPKSDLMCKWCEYKTLCNTENEVFLESIIQSQFKQSPWTPWKGVEND